MEDWIEVDTIDEADMFLPGMVVLLGDDEWSVRGTVSTITGFRILIERDV